MTLKTIFYKEFSKNRFDQNRTFLYGPQPAHEGDQHKLNSLQLIALAPTHENI